MGTKHDARAHWGSDSHEWLAIAAAFMGESDHTNACAAAELATATHPRSFDAWVQLGVCHARAKDYERAVPCYARALELRPDDVGAWCDLGEIFTLMLDYERAAAALRQAIVLDPNAEHPSGRRARAVVGRTLALLKKK